MASKIGTIIDYTAWVAGQIEGVQSVAGAGLGEIDDPLRPGRKIASADAEPMSDYAHWSELPSAPELEWTNQEGGAELEWLVPMRLWLPRNDIQKLRRTALPFYDRYLAAFVRDRTLGGNCWMATVHKMFVGAPRTQEGLTASDFAFLQVELKVCERVCYAD